MFDNFLQASPWRHDLGRLFGQSDLLSLQFFDPCLVSLNHGRACRLNDPVEQRFGLGLNILDLTLQRLFRATSLCEAHFPNVEEHGSEQPKELLSGL
ncbi:hypothetical protein ACP2AV_11080 [Aliiroseovarius sp. PTFE2010]|uniref:hypothetical protein n=1 Tax=Aliiroseovarius sp. PTFE2010 TaxID=3417190 RepID=UPI003CF409F4